MKTVAGLLMIANTALFFFGGVQHAGVSVGRFHEPLIIPAAIVESLCGLCLLWGAIALFRDWRIRWRIALTTNLIAHRGRRDYCTEESHSLNRLCNSQITSLTVALGFSFKQMRLC